MSEILRFKNVSKSFKNKNIINDLSFSVKEGSIFGFLGKNGEGKTTTLKMILGFLKPDKGEITVCDELVTFGNTKTNRYIGYLPDVPEFYNYMTPNEYLNLCGKISNLNNDVIIDRRNYLLNLVGLGNINKKILGFSRGMKQRLGIAQALLNNPKLLICDEPTSALDPIGRKEILEILEEAKKETTIIFSTHILSDVEKVCDKIGILNKGKFILQGNLIGIKDLYNSNSILIEVNEKENIDAVLNLIKLNNNVKKVEVSDNTVIINLKNLEDGSINLLSLLIKNNIFIKRYEICEPTLENLFLEAII